MHIFRSSSRINWICVCHTRAIKTTRIKCTLKIVDRFADDEYDCMCFKNPHVLRLKTTKVHIYLQVYIYVCVSEASWRDVGRFIEWHDGWVGRFGWFGGVLERDGNRFQQRTFYLRSSSSSSSSLPNDDADDDDGNNDDDDGNARLNVYAMCNCAYCLSMWIYIYICLTQHVCKNAGLEIRQDIVNQWEVVIRQEFVHMWLCEIDFWVKMVDSWISV